MFQHPNHPWMLADLDYLADPPDGTTAIVEIKTTNYNAKSKWWYNGEEIVPVYYESQARHADIDTEMERLKAQIVADLGTSCTGICEDGCTVTWKPMRKTGISKENLLRLKEIHPEIYREYVTTTVTRRFSIKQSKSDAA